MKKIYFIKYFIINIQSISMDNEINLLDNENTPNVLCKNYFHKIKCCSLLINRHICGFFLIFILLIILIIKTCTIYPKNIICNYTSCINY